MKIVFSFPSDINTFQLGIWLVYESLLFINSSSSWCWRVLVVSVNGVIIERKRGDAHITQTRPRCLIRDHTYTMSAYGLGGWVQKMAMFAGRSVLYLWWYNGWVGWLVQICADVINGPNRKWECFNNEIILMYLLIIILNIIQSYQISKTLILLSGNLE